MHAVLASPTNREFRASGEATTSGDKHGMPGEKDGRPPAGQAPERGLGPPPRAQHAPPSPVPTPPAHPLAAADDEAPASHGAGGVGLPYRLHHPLLGHATDSGGPREGVAGNRKRRYRLGLRHLRRPGALQGHHEGPRAQRAQHAQASEQRGAGTALPVAGRTVHHTKPRKASESVRCVRGPRSRERRQADHGKAGSGRSLHTPPAPPTSPPRRAEAKERGARGQNEKSGLIRHECPSLV